MFNNRLLSTNFSRLPTTKASFFRECGTLQRPGYRKELYSNFWKQNTNHFCSGARKNRFFMFSHLSDIYASVSPREWSTGIQIDFVHGATVTNPKKHRYIPSFQARVPLISVLKAGGKNNNRQNPLYGNLLNNNASLLRKVNSVPGERKPLQFHTPETNNIGRLGISVLAQRVPGSFGWTSVTYDRLMVALDTIHQPKITLVHPSQKSLHRKLVPIPLIVSGVGIFSQLYPLNREIPLKRALSIWPSQCLYLTGFECNSYAC